MDQLRSLAWLCMSMFLALMDDLLTPGLMWYTKLEVMQPTELKKKEQIVTGDSESYGLKCMWLHGI